MILLNKLAFDCDRIFFWANDAKWINVFLSCQRPTNSDKKLLISDYYFYLFSELILKKYQNFLF